MSSFSLSLPTGPPPTSQPSFSGNSYGQGSAPVPTQPPTPHHSQAPAFMEPSTSLTPAQLAFLRSMHSPAQPSPARSGSVPMPVYSALPRQTQASSQAPAQMHTNEQARERADNQVLGQFTMFMPRQRLPHQSHHQERAPAPSHSAESLPNIPSVPFVVPAIPQRKASAPMHPPQPPRSSTSPAGVNLPPSVGSSRDLRTPQSGSSQQGQMVSRGWTSDTQHGFGQAQTQHIPPGYSLVPIYPAPPAPGTVQHRRLAPQPTGPHAQISSTGRVPEAPHTPTTSSSVHYQQPSATQGHSSVPRPSARAVTTRVNTGPAVAAPQVAGPSTSIASLPHAAPQANSTSQSPTPTAGPSPGQPDRRTPTTVNPGNIDIMTAQLLAPTLSGLDALVARTQRDAQQVYNNTAQEVRAHLTRVHVLIADRDLHLKHVVQQSTSAVLKLTAELDGERKKKADAEKREKDAEDRLQAVYKLLAEVTKQREGLLLKLGNEQPHNVTPDVASSTAVIEQVENMRVNDLERRLNQVTAQFEAEKAGRDDADKTLQGAVAEIERLSSVVTNLPSSISPRTAQITVSSPLPGTLIEQLLDRSGGETTSPRSAKRRRTDSPHGSTHNTLPLGTPQADDLVHPSRSFLDAREIHSNAIASALPQSQPSSPLNVIQPRAAVTSSRGHSLSTSNMQLESSRESSCAPADVPGLSFQKLEIESTPDQPKHNALNLDLQFENTTALDDIRIHPQPESHSVANGIHPPFNTELESSEISPVVLTKMSIPPNDYGPMMDGSEQPATGGPNIASEVVELQYDEEMEEGELDGVEVPPVDPKDLGIQKLLLVYQEVNNKTRFRCRMCVRQNQADHSVPIISFPIETSFIELAGHVTAAHPEGAVALVAMSDGDVTEYHFKFSAMEQ